MKFIVQDALHDLSHRDQLPALLTKMGISGEFVEVGCLYGTYSQIILNSWPGHLSCVDPWLNQDRSVYHDGANLMDMNALWQGVNATIGQNPRCTLIRAYSLNAAGMFNDEELGAVYLDGNHALDAIRADIAAWWPKVKIGGIVSGHDYNVRYDNDTNSDAMTAVAELSEALGIRAHVTWCTSWYFIKTEEADQRFREACINGELPRPVYSDNAKINLVPVMPVAKFDWNLAVKGLKFMRELDSEKAPAVTILVSPDLTNHQTATLLSVAPTGSSIVAANVKELGYFGTPNQMFKAGIEYVEKFHPKDAMLWIEADAVPMHEDWFESITGEWHTCGRPFMGQILREGEIPHMTGNGVYHPDWRRMAPGLAKLGQEQCGWDTLCADDIVPRAHDSTTIQQIWRPAKFTKESAAKLIPKTTALFHQCKDGSLIDVLCDNMEIPRIPLEKALAVSTYETQDTKYDGPRSFNSSNPQAYPIPPKVEILIVTFARDMDFLRNLVNSIMRFKVGFHGVTIAAPDTERGSYDWLPRDVKMHYYADVPGKGMLMHLAQKMRADEICPEADIILHMDSDNMCWKEFNPGDFMPYNRPIIVREKYEICGVRNTNRMYWKETVTRATGLVPEWECMVRHPQIYLRGLYKRTREIMEKHTGRNWMDYILDGQNHFPQSFCEFNTLGAVACSEFEKKYTMVEYDRDRDAREFGMDPSTAWQYIYRKDRDALFECWSHGGYGMYEKFFLDVIRGQGPAFIVK